MGTNYDETLLPGEVTVSWVGTPVCLRWWSCDLGFALKGESLHTVLGV